MEMKPHIIIRSELPRMNPELRRDILTQKVRSMSDAELRALAKRRERKDPGRRLHPVGIGLPSDVLDRLTAAGDGPEHSVSALVDRLLAGN